MSRARYFQTLSFLETSVLLHSTPKIKAFRKWREGLDQDSSLAMVIPVSIDADYLAAVTESLPLSALVIRTPPDFSPSAANRDRIREALLGDGPPRVWEAQGLWELSAAARIAQDCGALVALDPLASDPLEESAEILAAQLARDRVYLRLSGLGSARHRFRQYDLERVAEMIADCAEAWVSFGNAAKHKDALALRKLLETHPAQGA